MTAATLARPARKAAAKPAYEPQFARVHDRESGVCLGYLVQPETSTAKWYEVHCDAKGAWHCTCDGNAVWHKECKHIKLVKADCEARVAAGRPGCWQGRDVAVEEAAEVAVPQRRTARLTGADSELLEGIAMSQETRRDEDGREWVKVGNSWALPHQVKQAEAYEAIADQIADGQRVWESMGVAERAAWDATQHGEPLTVARLATWRAQRAEAAPLARAQRGGFSLLKQSA